MKIACLTFHNSSNYGSVLQAYALQQTVKSLGHDYEIIDYSTSEKYKHDSLFGKNRELQRKHYLYKLASLPYNYIKKRKFVDFSRSFLHVAYPRFRRLRELDGISDKYDFYICGSDQVWNAKMIRFDSAYFLSFVKNVDKKIAYACSFGRVDMTDLDREFYTHHLMNIDKISVREQSAQKIVFECAHKNAELVLDPTLLFTPQQWVAFANARPLLKKPYILTYCLGKRNPEMRKFIKLLKEQTGLKVIGISSGLIGMMNERAFAIPSPAEYVALFANAEYIVTNSFHGTAFSSNLNRNFFSFVMGTKTSLTNSRIVDFLELLGLEERLMTAFPRHSINLNAPNFQKANSILLEKRKSSIEFLNISLNDKK